MTHMSSSTNVHDTFHSLLFRSHNSHSLHILEIQGLALGASSCCRLASIQPLLKPRTRHITRMNKSFHAYERVTTRIHTNHDANMNESRHVTHLQESPCILNESRHTHERGTSPVTHMNESCHTYERVAL